MSFWEDVSPKLYPLNHHVVIIFFHYTLYYIYNMYINLSYHNEYDIATNLTTNTTTFLKLFHRCKMAYPEPSSAEAKAKRSAQRAPNLPGIALW